VLGDVSLAGPIMYDMVTSSLFVIMFSFGSKHKPLSFHSHELWDVHLTFRPLLLDARESLLAKMNSVCEHTLLADPDLRCTMCRRGREVLRLGLVVLLYESQRVDWRLSWRGRAPPDSSCACAVLSCRGS
jgi:hypothetical protein